MGDVKTNLRLPEELYDAIKRIADEELRSINQQMVALLRQAVADHQRAEKKAETEAQP